MSGIKDIRPKSYDDSQQENYKVLGLLIESIKVKMNLPNNDGALLFTAWEYQHCTQYWWKTIVDEIRQEKGLSKLKDGHDKDVFERLQEDYIPSEDSEEEEEKLW